MSNKMNSAIGRSWEDVEKDLYTKEEISKSNLRVALIGEIINARKKMGLNWKRPEEMSGVKQPVIARMEKGSTSPQIETVLTGFSRENAGNSSVKNKIKKFRFFVYQNEAQKLRTQGCFSMEIYGVGFDKQNVIISRFLLPKG